MQIFGFDINASGCNQATKCALEPKLFFSLEAASMMVLPRQSGTKVANLEAARN